MAEFAIIFDMDGVLVDSMPHIFAAFKKVLSGRGIAITDKQLLALNGVSMTEAVVVWKEWFGVEIEPHAFCDEATALEIELARKHHREDAELFRFLRELKERGVPLAVATASTRPRAEQYLALAQVANLFDTVVTAEDAARSKPAPDLFLKAAERLGVDPARCIVIEDAPFGIRAAKAAGMRAIGLVTAHHLQAELGDADLFVRGFGELSYERAASLFRQ